MARSDRSGPGARSGDRVPEVGDRDLADHWRPRPRRLLIAVALIAVGLGWMALNGASGAYKAATPPATHGPAATRVQTIGTVRVRPELPRGVPQLRAAVVDISFHNTGGAARRISPHDLRLVVGTVAVQPLPAAGSHALRAIVLPPGRYVTGEVRFAHPLAPGATLVYRPSWQPGRTLHWLLWQ